MIWWAILFFGIGALLILAEFLLPGAILGILGALCVVGSTILAIYAYPGEVPLIITIEVLALVGSVGLGLIIISRTGLAGGLTLRTSQHVEEGYVNLPSDHRLVGATGTVFTALRPAGTVVIGAERLDAVSDGVFIDKGEMVRVVEVHGNRIVVEPLDLSGADDRRNLLDA